MRQWTFFFFEKKLTSCHFPLHACVRRSMIGSSCDTEWRPGVALKAVVCLGRWCVEEGLNGLIVSNDKICLSLSLQETVIFL